MPTWPRKLPQEFEYRGFLEQLGDQLIKSSLSQGLERSRRPGRHYSEGKSLRGVFLMNKDEWAIFEDFHNNTLSGGTLPFTVPGPDGALVEAEFDKAPSMKNVGWIWYRVSVSFSVL